MLHDLVIVGAGPVGATLALALSDSDLDVVALDARPAGSIARSDRSLALSHGTRLVFERLGVWSEVTATPGAVTPITAIDISQRGGFGRARLHARDQGVDALGYVVSYRALQHALDSALARAGMSIEHGVDVTRVSATAESAHVVGERNGAAVEWSARLAAVADGGGEVVDYIARRRHDYRKVALVARIWSVEPHGGLAFERFTDEGPMALLPEGDHYGLVWTTTPDNAGREFKRQREGAPIGNASPWPGAGPETLSEGFQKPLFRQRDQCTRIFRSCRPHQAVMILFGQERHRTLVGKALERESAVRLTGPDLRHQRNLSVVVPASPDVVHDVTTTIGDRGQTCAPFDRGAVALTDDMSGPSCRAHARHTDAMLDRHAHTP